MQAIDQIAYEKKIPAERILETVEAALAAAYRKDFGHPEQQVRAKLNPESGESEVYIVHEVVEEVENPHMQITVEEAKKKKMKDPKVGDELVEKVKPPEDYGRIAAQTAKQVIIQRIREVEREIVQEEFAERVGELMTGSVQRIEGRNVFVEIGRAIGVMNPEDQIDSERYYIGQRLRVLLRDLDPEGRAAQLILTRSHPDFVKHLFELEVPEIHAGTVEIKSIAREAGVRTKVAVHSNQDGVDPVGTCVGQRGTRVQAIMAELGDEKIDIVLFDEDSKTYIANALSPAKISRIELDEENRQADIIVSDDQLSLAIGRGGQNVRLAGDLTGWQLDIEKTEGGRAGRGGETKVTGIPIAEVEGVTEDEAAKFAEGGLKTAQQVAAATPDELAVITEVPNERQEEILKLAAEAVSSSGDIADSAVAEREADAKETEEDTDIEKVPEPSDEELKAVEVDANADKEAAGAEAAGESDAKAKGKSDDKSPKAEEKPAEEPVKPTKKPAEPAESDDAKDEAPEKPADDAAK